MLQSPQQSNPMISGACGPPPPPPGSSPPGLLPGFSAASITAAQAHQAAAAAAALAAAQQQHHGLHPHDGFHPHGAGAPPHPHQFHPHMHPNHHAEPPKPRFMFKMPRVVPNQKEKFETDDLMKRHSREGEVRHQPEYCINWSLNTLGSNLSSPSCN